MWVKINSTLSNFCILFEKVVLHKIKMSWNKHWANFVQVILYLLSVPNLIYAVIHSCMIQTKLFHRCHMQTINHSVTFVLSRHFWRAELNIQAHTTILCTLPCFIVNKILLWLHIHCENTLFELNGSIITCKTESKARTYCLILCC